MKSDKETINAKKGGKGRKILALAVLACFFCFHPNITSFSQDGDGMRISTPEEIGAEFDSVPCKNSERKNAVMSLFEKMGAKPDEVTIDKIKKVENVVIRKPGAAPEITKDKIVIGAHYDKVDLGCGAVDNWTGIVALAHVYRTIKDVPLNKTVLFVAFDQEEKGLVGSEAMVDRIKKEEVPEYCGMINIDSLGLAVPQVIENISSKKLVDLSVRLAQEMKMPFEHGPFREGDSDSSSFLRKKIPAVMIHAMSKDWKSILHTGNDQVKNVKPDSVYLSYRLALALLVEIDKSECQAFR